MPPDVRKLGVSVLTADPKAFDAETEEYDELRNRQFFKNVSWLWVLQNRGTTIRIANAPARRPRFPPWSRKVKEAPTANPPNEPLAPLNSSNRTEVTRMTIQTGLQLRCHSALMDTIPAIAAYRPTPVLRRRPPVKSYQWPGLHYRNDEGCRILSPRSR